MARTAGSKKVKKNVVIGQVFIKTSFNNTLVSVTDAKGNVIASSGGDPGQFGDCDGDRVLNGVDLSKYKPSEKDIGLSKDFYHVK